MLYKTLQRANTRGHQTHCVSRPYTVTLTACIVINTLNLQSERSEGWDQSDNDDEKQ